ncbi:hypothetical protein NL496_28115, partial [Klebsiella pneumoniae]|nr:hypothetical protein [Klebsiella pneumoniae]
FTDFSADFGYQQSEFLNVRPGTPADTIPSHHPATTTHPATVHHTPQHTPQLRRISRSVELYLLSNLLDFVGLA